MKPLDGSAGQQDNWLELIGQFFRYGLVGIINTAVGLGTIVALQSFAGLGPYWANAGGYATGLAASFWLNRAWTFQVHGRTTVRLVLFMLAFGLAYMANFATLALLLGRVEPLVAQVGAMAVYSVLFFILCRVVVFAKGATSCSGQRTGERGCEWPCR